VYTVGLQAKPTPNVVLKLDYRNRQARRGELGDEINVGLGVVF
jgi:opacity protein-like surface antigen